MELLKNPRNVYILIASAGGFICMCVCVVIALLIGANNSSQESLRNSENMYDSSGYVDSSDQYQGSNGDSIFDYDQDYISGALWIGSMYEKKFSQSQKMHATYTYTFSYKLADTDRTITKVEVTGISAETSLPGGTLKILPYAHVSYSEHGGTSIPSTLMYEDWNTYGYTYISDYSKMNSLGDSYQPNICDEETLCDYLDEVGQQGGRISLRFKYIDVGTPTETRPDYEAINVINAMGISPSQLSGNFSWVLNITLDDGTVETREYGFSVDGEALDLSDTNTISIASSY